MQEDIFVKNLPHIDLHGYDKDSAVVATQDFINDNVIMGNKKIVIVHGKGMGILSKSISAYLRNDKRVENYYIDSFNNGITIVVLK